MLKEFYLNIKQRQFLSSKAPYRVIIAARSFGKGVLIAWSIVEKLAHLPGAKGMLTCITLKQLKNKTIPNMQKIWKLVGLQMGVDYWVFTKPPKTVINKMVSPPTDFRDIISFSNGMHLECISSKQYDAARGGSYDFVEGDEMCFFPEDFFTSVCTPSRRGNKELYSSHCHHQISLYSSMSKTLEGMWIVNKFEKLHRVEPKNYFYMEATIEDNIDVYTWDNLRMDQKTMPYLTFQIEFYNFRIQQAENMFYFKFEEKTHLYGSVDSTAKDLHYNPKKALDVSIDLGGWYSCAGVFQESNNTEYQINHFDAKKDASIDDLVDKICEGYKRHTNKLIRLYGDPRGHDQTIMGKTAYVMMAERFIQNGWQVDIRVTNYATEQHQWRYNVMNEILEEKDTALPKLRIHRSRCADSIVALHMTESTNDFKKNKSKERDREFPQEHAPHNTDLIDYLFLQKHGWKLGLQSKIMPNTAG